MKATKSCGMRHRRLQRRKFFRPANFSLLFHSHPYIELNRRSNKFRQLWIPCCCGNLCDSRYFTLTAVVEQLEQLKSGKKWRNKGKLWDGRNAEWDGKRKKNHRNFYLITHSRAVSAKAECENVISSENGWQKRTIKWIDSARFIAAAAFNHDYSTSLYFFSRQLLSNVKFNPIKQKI